jgi:hypothetical protein
MNQTTTTNPLPMKRDGYRIHLAALGCKTFDLVVVDSNSAKEVFCQYRDSHNLGSSDLKKGCGDVTDANGKLVARISYNGNLWDSAGNLVSSERNQ